MYCQDLMSASGSAVRLCCSSDCFPGSCPAHVRLSPCHSPPEFSGSSSGCPVRLSSADRLSSFALPDEPCPLRPKYCSALLSGSRSPTVRLRNPTLALPYPAPLSSCASGGVRRSQAGSAARRSLYLTTCWFGCLALCGQLSSFHSSCYPLPLFGSHHATVPLGTVRFYSPALCCEF